MGVLLLASGAVWYVASIGLLRGKQTAAAPAPLPIQVQAPPTGSPSGSPAATDPTGSIRDSADAAARRTVTIIDGMSGKRQEVVIGAPEPSPGAATGQRSR